MKWTIEKQFKFEAAHLLPSHDGKCRRLHGHSWVGFVRLSESCLFSLGPKAGMLMDFGDIKAAIEHDVAALLDHQYLNDTLPMENPTSEEIARYLFDRWQIPLSGLVSVRIEETCTSAAEYWGE